MSRQPPGGRSDAQVVYYSTFFSFFYSCVTPPPLFGPAGCSSPRLPDSFCNEYVQRIPSLWNMMDEECRKYVHR